MQVSWPLPWYSDCQQVRWSSKTWSFLGSIQVYQSFRAAIRKYHTLGSLNNRNLLSLSFGDQKAKIRVVAGLVSSEGVTEDLVCASLTAFSGWLAIFGIPLLIDAAPQSLPSSSHGILPVCLSASESKSPLFVSYIGLGPSK